MIVIHRRMSGFRQSLMVLAGVSLVMMFAVSCDNANPSSTKDDDNPEDPVISSSTVEDIDGNVYTTVKIGDQVWTVENLRVTKYNDGSAIPNVTDSAQWRDLKTGAYCFYDNSTDVAYRKKWGALYNWYAIDTKKISPKGWHVPTDADWDILKNYLIANGYNWDGTKTENRIARSLAAKTDWKTSWGNGIGNDLSKNNASGFSALPGGDRDYDGGFYNQSDIGLWWSATESGATNAWYRYLDGVYSASLLRDNGYSQSCGFSVRLVKD